MKRTRILFLVFLTVMIAVAFVVGRKTADNLELLQAEGFTISRDMNGVPRLLVDEPRQQIAIVDNKGYRKLNYSQIERLEIAFDGQKEAPVNYRIEIFSSALDDDRVSIVYENEWRARQEYARFRKIIGH
ncbi:MAG: hypothetical protein OIF57_14525 [Marinobacterium sp.]|nr:hypothetical protein [Marinobacterium sp.]